ncbi:MAG TPA: PIN domain nuclease, partial [Deltaproteobacteria bacterium]|nr:PIN domain nuclease [Deltaproteobacteria bacterium]
MKYLLDTAAFLWMIFGEEDKLSKKALRIIDGNEDLHLRLVSIWEIVIKHSIGKIELKKPPKQWLPEIISEMGLKQLPISQRHILEVSELEKIHHDP